MLKTICITLPEGLLTEIDRTVAELGTDRSSFARHAFEDALYRAWVEKAEQQHARAYAHQPEDANEMALWESAQDWEDHHATR